MNLLMTVNVKWQEDGLCLVKDRNNFIAARRLRIRKDTSKSSETHQSELAFVVSHVVVASGSAQKRDQANADARLARNELHRYHASYWQTVEQYV